MVPIPNCFYSTISSVRLAGSNSFIHWGGGGGGGGGAFCIRLFQKQTDREEVENMEFPEVLKK